jgi:hypothetical protein
MLYYLDAAIYEDIRNVRDNWKTLPATHFLNLSESGHAAIRVVRHIRSIISAQLDRFNVISNLSPLSIEDFINMFIGQLMEPSHSRTLINAIYVFLLESDQRLNELRLKSTQGTSLGPIITHLFSGSILFESLLKHKYPTKDNGDPCKTLGEIFNSGNFRNDFGVSVRAIAYFRQSELDRQEQSE